MDKFDKMSQKEREEYLIQKIAVLRPLVEEFQTLISDKRFKIPNGKVNLILHQMSQCKVNFNADIKSSKNDLCNICNKPLDQCFEHARGKSSGLFPDILVTSSTSNSTESCSLI